MRPSYRHANRAVTGALPNALIPAGARQSAPGRTRAPVPAGAGPLAPTGAGALPHRVGDGAVPARAGARRRRLPSLSKPPEAVVPGTVPGQGAAPASEGAGAVPPLC